MWNHWEKYSILVFGAMFLSGCSLLFGIKNIKSFDQEKYDKVISGLSKKFDFTALVADTIQYRKTIRLGETEEQKKCLSQPVQVLYFKHSEPVSYHVNCYAKPKLGSLNWNTEDRFDVFVPKTAVELEDVRFTLKDFREIYPIEPVKEYTILIFWTRMAERIAADALKEVNENLVKFEQKEQAAIFLINSDQFFSDY